MHHPTDRITHTTAFVTPVMEHWLEREIAQWVHPMKDRSDDPPHHERTLYLWATSRSPYYGNSHMVKDCSDSKRGNLMLIFYATSDQFMYIRIVHTTAFVAPVVEHWLEREIAEWVHHEGPIWQFITPWMDYNRSTYRLCITLGPILNSEIQR